MLQIDNMPQINPHMKFTPPKIGVVAPSAVYTYSLQDELQLGDNQYKQILGSMKRRSLANIAEKHPNLKTNIFSVVKLAMLVLAGWMGVRYRHSIPVLKDICKLPKKTPPNFKQDMEKIWQSIVK